MVPYHLSHLPSRCTIILATSLLRQEVSFAVHNTEKFFTMHACAPVFFATACGMHTCTRCMNKTGVRKALMLVHGVHAPRRMRAGAHLCDGAKGKLLCLRAQLCELHRAKHHQMDVLLGRKVCETRGLTDGWAQQPNIRQGEAR